MTEPSEDGLDYSYDSYVSQVPEALRGQVEPAFKAYSEGIQGKVTEQLGQYEPYKEFIEQGWEPQHVGMGLNLLQQLSEDPQKIYEALVNEYPNLVQQTPQQQQQTPQGQQQQTYDPADYNLPPELTQRLDQQEQLIQLLSQGFMQTQQASQQAAQQQQEQAELAQFTEELDKIAPSDKYPRHFILSYIAQGQSPTEAVKSFSDWQTSQFQQRNGQSAPLIAPASGGGLVSEPIDTAKLTDVQRRDLMTRYLEAANQQR